MSIDDMKHQAAAKMRGREGKASPKGISPRALIARARHRVEASPEERLRRLEICEQCPHAIVSRIAGRDVARCGACGCPLSTRTRMKYIPGYGEVHCPKGKW